MKKAVALLLICMAGHLISIAAGDHPQPLADRQYIELRVYHFNSAAQMAVADSFFHTALLPALHSAGVSRVGVFSAVGNDTATDKKMYLLVPYKNLKQFEKAAAQLSTDEAYNKAGTSFLAAVYNNPPYSRYETMLLHAFTDMPEVAAPKLSGNKSDRVYELRSYEGPTDAAYQNKVQMFNAGGEVKLFDRLGFNAVFYGEVVSGSHMPNLMYMTSFENKAARDEHWKTFSADAEWKTLSAEPEYQHNVSKIEITFLKAMAYSDL